MNERNARIKSTFLGIEDHGCFTFLLNLDYGGSGQSAGGYVLTKSFKIIKTILELVGVDTWEELPGRYIKVQADGGRVHAIRNILSGEWLNFEEYFKKEG